MNWVNFTPFMGFQYLGEADEPWIHQLLLAVAKHTSLAALINTSAMAQFQF